MMVRPRLRRYPGPSGVVQVFDVQVGALADDGMSDATPFYGVNFIRIGSTTDNPDRDSWVRFPNVTIPGGATIVVAYMTVESKDSDNDGVGVKTNIYAEDADDAIAPTDRTEHQADVRTTSFTVWDDEDFVVDTPTDSPSIVNVIQEIVDRGGWNSGQALMILWDDDETGAGVLQYALYDYFDDTTRAIKLHVEYTT